MVFNFICAAMFFAFFICFVVFQGGISKHLQMCKCGGRATCHSSLYAHVPYTACHGHLHSVWF